MVITILEAVLSVALLGAVILVNRLIQTAPSEEVESPGKSQSPRIPGTLPTDSEKRKKKKKAKGQSQSLPSANASAKYEKDVLSTTAKISLANSTVTSEKPSKSSRSPPVATKRETEAAKSAQPDSSNPVSSTSTLEPLKIDTTAQVSAAREAENDQVSEPISPDYPRPAHASGVRVLKIIGSSDKMATKKAKTPTEAAELTKRQRQNKKKYEAMKEAKAMQQEEQERRLREFKQQKARDAMVEQQRLEAQKIRLATLPKQEPVGPTKKKPSPPPAPVEDISTPSFNQALDGQSWESVPSRKSTKQTRNTSRAVDDVPDIPDSRFAMPANAMSWD
ncbi:hypothetical protein V1517DRAFT_321450 [Lipomyces orientalis]|uniref:Uncharacterized protein n=1 Tax=Lipomyces orientalis TaxID=1233043 RepID=A0ACC3TQ29_9ASCO